MGVGGLVSANDADSYAEGVDVKRWTLGNIAVCVGWALTLITAVAWASAFGARVDGRIAENETRVIDQEHRIRTLEQRVGEMATDVKWIRQTMERQMERKDGTK